AAEGAVVGQRLAVLAEAGAEVEDDRRLAMALDDDARGVAAVARVGRPRAWGGPPHSMERHVQHPVSPFRRGTVTDRDPRPASSVTQVSRQRTSPPGRTFGPRWMPPTSRSRRPPSPPVT